MPTSESTYQFSSETSYSRLDAPNDTERLLDVSDAAMRRTYGSLAEKEPSFVSSKEVSGKSNTFKRFVNGFEFHKHCVNIALLHVTP